MTRGSLIRLALTAIVALLAVWPLSLAAQGDEDGSFNGAHWARKSNPFTLDLGDNVSGNWDKYLKRASGEWSDSKDLNMDIVRGGTKPKKCKPTSGRVEVCSANYKNNGWLGLTRIWTDDDNHITKATVQINDYYFDDDVLDGHYNKPVAKRHTMCHELGHTIGLDHVNTNSCMNPSQDAVFENDKPIKQDFNTIEDLYDHRDDYKTVGNASADAFFDVTAAEANPPLPSAKDDNRSVMVEKLGGGRELVTFISWA